MATKRKNGNGNGNGKELEKWNHEVTELELFVENEGKLYDAKKRVIEAMKAKIERGQYNEALAVQGWRHWVDEGVKEYGRQFRMTDLAKAFPSIVRNEVARRIAEGEAAAIRNGDYGKLETKATKSSASVKANAKYRTKYEGPTNSHGARIVVTTLSTGKRRSVPYDHGAHDPHEAAVREIAGHDAQLDGLGDGRGGKYWAVTKEGTKEGKRYEHSANMWKPKPGDKDHAAKQARLTQLERQFKARAEKVPSNVNLFDDPEIASIIKQRDRIIESKGVKGAANPAKIPRINVGRIQLNRQGYTPTGRYFGVGAPLWRAFNTANNEEVEFRAADSTTARSIAKKMFTEPGDPSVTQRFTPGQVKQFVAA